MKTRVEIDGERFLINGRPTYEGVADRGRKIEGLLLNSRMIQAIFDDECPETGEFWRYPDTGVWDPNRNTQEFCLHLAEYRSYGLLAVTVGLQGGGSIYTPEVYDRYINSAFRADGSIKQAYLERLHWVLDAADRAGMVVIVNYFYYKQAARIASDKALYSVTEAMTDWLLSTGFENVLVDVANESASWWNRPAVEPENIHRLIEIVKRTTLRGRRLLASSSTAGGDQIPTPSWLESEDFSLPHGNGCSPSELRDKLRRIKSSDEYRKRPRPVVVNEDSTNLDNMDAAIREYCSWGFFSQGYGSGFGEWAGRPRERRYEDLSGFQTVPINWAINTPDKKAFFERVREITGGH